MKANDSVLFCLCVVFLYSAPISKATNDPASDAANLLSKMTLSEKLDMVHGQLGHYIGNTVENERLSIPSLNMQDGPQGFRTTTSTGPDGSTTAWPSALTAAASWDKDLLYRWAAAMAEEFKGKGANVQLAPGIGMARVPTAGRNFEYLCGEDPWLGSILGASVVRGIQDQGVIANAKHWINNDIEDQRSMVSANVDERVRFELYYPPFEAAIKAGVLSVMCSYNRVNDVHACSNEDTLSHLKQTMGFQGWVMSDWLATHSTVDSVNAGMDQEMPVGLHYRSGILKQKLENGEIELSSINDSVYRMLLSMFTVGLFDHEPVGDRNAIVTSAEHNALAREIAGKSIVLLKNEPVQGGESQPILPLANLSDPVVIKSILVVGDNSTVSGGGSGHVKPAYIVTPEEGILNGLPTDSNVSVMYIDGTDIDLAVTMADSVDIVIAVVATTSSEGTDRESLSLGELQDNLIFALSEAYQAKLIVAVNSPGACLMPWAHQVNALLMVWLPGQEWGNALADVLFGKVNPSGKLPVTIPNKDNEVGFTAEQYPGTGQPPEAIYSEQLLIGYRYYDAYGMTPLFPFGHGRSYTTFTYDSMLVSPTVAAMDRSANAKLSTNKKPTLTDDVAVVTISVVIRNTGTLAGSEVVQLYISFPDSAQEPLRQLKGFIKTPEMPPEEITRGLSVSTHKENSANESNGNSNSTEIVEFTLTERDLSIWDTEAHAWSFVCGDFTAYAAKSSRDLLLTCSFKIPCDE